jgi:hypothetical protein
LTFGVWLVFSLVMDDGGCVIYGGMNSIHAGVHGRGGSLGVWILHAHCS